MQIEKSCLINLHKGVICLTFCFSAGCWAWSWRLRKATRFFNSFSSNGSALSQLCGYEYFTSTFSCYLWARPAETKSKWNTCAHTIERKLSHWTKMNWRIGMLTHHNCFLMHWLYNVKHNGNKCEQFPAEFKMVHTKLSYWINKYQKMSLNIKTCFNPLDKKNQLEQTFG